FTDGAWLKDTGVTVTDSTLDVPDPKGTNTASKIVYDGSAGGGFFVYNVFLSMAPHDPLTIGVWLRTAAGSFSMLLRDNASLTVATITLTAQWQLFTHFGRSEGQFAGLIALYRLDNTPRTFYAWGASAAKANRLGPYVRTTTAVIVGPIRNSKF